MEKSEYKTLYEIENEHWWHIALHDLVEHYIAQKGSGLKIFDAGCGTGGLMQTLEKYGVVEGIDGSDEAIDFCMKRGLKKVRLLDLNAWKSEPDHYDAIICMDVLCHESIKDDLQMIKNFHAGLKPGGKLILNLPAFNYLMRDHDIVVKTVRRYRKKNFLDKIEHIGFSFEKVSYRLPLLFVILLVLKCCRFFSPPKKKAESDLKNMPPLINRMLLNANLFENWMIKNNVSFPFGSSLFIAARKKE